MIETKGYLLFVEFDSRLGSKRMSVHRFANAMQIEFHKSDMVLTNSSMRETENTFRVFITKH